MLTMTVKLFYSLSASVFNFNKVSIKMNNEATYKQCYEDSLFSLGRTPYYFIDRFIFNVLKVSS